MSEETAGTAPKEKRARKVTFVCIQDGEVKLVRHETNACSINEAWREAAPADSDTKLVGAVPGHVDFMKNHIRKPTYKEMESMLSQQNATAQ